jgi:hypothetical protein
MNGAMLRKLEPPIVESVESVTFAYDEHSFGASRFHLALRALRWDKGV